ncbi:MAG: DMT family transporter [Cytophagales bacterium]|nr:DMT family transporter [Cytophagales bacterium]
MTATHNLPQRKAHLDLIAISLLLACCIFWGWQQVLVKATLPFIPPVMQVAMRFVLGTAVLLLWCYWRKIKLLGSDGTLKAGLLAGSLFALEFIFLYVGLVHTSASRLTIFLYTAPFVVALVLPRFVASEQLKLVQWLGLACAFVAVVFAMMDNLTGGSWLGDGLALAAGVMWGLTTVVIRATKLSGIGAEKLLFYQLAVSAALLVPLSFLFGENWTSTLTHMTAFAWTSLAVQAVVGAFASYLTWMWLLGHYPATKLSSFVFLTPVFSLVIGAWWLGEPITVSLVASLVLVGAGIVLVNRK